MVEEGATVVAAAAMVAAGGRVGAVAAMVAEGGEKVGAGSGLHSRSSRSRRARD